MSTCRTGLVVSRSARATSWFSSARETGMRAEMREPAMSRNADD
jgi:hypothetical protein